MLKGGLNGLEAGFLATVDASARGAREGAAGAPAAAKAKLLLEPPAATISFEEMHRRRREQERRAVWERLGRYNQEAFADQQRAFGVSYMQSDTDWRGL